MFGVLLQGILLGLVVSISAGPSFFALVQIGIQRKFKYGLAMSFGISLSDLTLVIVSYFGLASFISGDENTVIIGTIGGGILILFGAYSVLTAKKGGTKTAVTNEDFIPDEPNEFLKPIELSINKVEEDVTDGEGKTPSKKENRPSRISKMFGSDAGPLTYLLKGYFINILNPVVLILWAGAVVTVTSMSNENSIEQNVVIFFSGSMAIILLFNLLKVLLGKQIKNILKARIIELVNIIVGLIFVVCGFALIINVLFFM